jgi:sugar/nucleoside kinase (ribokinase family)
LASEPRTFDVICAGETTWRLKSPPSRRRGDRPRAPDGVFVPSPGALRTAHLLARNGLTVALVTTLPDDDAGRAVLARAESAAIDVTGVRLVTQQPSFFLSEGMTVVPQGRAKTFEPAVSIPRQLSSRVLVLSGLLPTMSYAASFCRAARAARRAGTSVVVDVNARRAAWAGSDSRAIRSILREGDVVFATAGDFVALGADSAALQTAMRADATFVVSSSNGDARAVGPFGVVVRAPARGKGDDADTSRDVLGAAICEEMVKASKKTKLEAGPWMRAFERTATRGRLPLRL